MGGDVRPHLHRQGVDARPHPHMQGGGWVDHAARLAGLAGVLLGWRPQEFWTATPAELAAVLRVLAGAEGEGLAAADGATLARLKEMYPDG